MNGIEIAWPKPVVALLQFLKYLRIGKKAEFTCQLPLAGGFSGVPG